MKGNYTMPDTLNAVMIKERGVENLILKAKSISSDIYKVQCTFENTFWRWLKENNDTRFEEYNKATGLGRSAMCLNEEDYERRAIILAALEAYIERLREE